MNVIGSTNRVESLKDVIADVMSSTKYQNTTSNTNISQLLSQKKTNSKKEAVISKSSIDAFADLNSEEEKIRQLVHTKKIKNKNSNTSSISSSSASVDGNSGKGSSNRVKERSGDRMKKDKDILSAKAKEEWMSLVEEEQHMKALVVTKVTSVQEAAVNRKYLHAGTSSSVNNSNDSIS
jgi:hypothetical protein